jgi:hypothetical protein
MLIPVYNPTVDDLERSFLSSGISAGVISLTIDNNTNYAINDRIMIGELGREKTEVVTVTGAVSAGTTLTVGATLFPHEAGAPVTRLRYDQVKFYRSTTGSTGTYSLLTTINLDVDTADLLTKYDDTTGLSTYYYKVSFYNSVSTLESALSDPIAGSGYSRNTVGFMIDEILREVADKQETFVDRTEVLGWFNEVNDDLLTRVKKPYSFLHTRTAVGRTAQNASGAGAYLSFPTDMWKFDRLDYNFVDTTVTPNTSITYTVRMLPPEEFRNRFPDTLDSASSLNNNDTLQFGSIDDAVSRIRLWPPSKTTSSNVFYIYYWKTFTQLDSEGDTFETPTPRVYKLYALGKFFRKRSGSDPIAERLANSYFQDYNQEVSKLKRADNKDAGTPKSFKYLPQTNKGWRQY